MIDARSELNLGAPCYKCEEREIGCHAKCDKYLDFRLEQDKRNKEKHERKEKNYQHREYVRKAINRFKAGKRKASDK